MDIRFRIRKRTVENRWIKHITYDMWYIEEKTWYGRWKDAKLPRALSRERIEDVLLRYVKILKRYRRGNRNGKV